MANVCFFVMEYLCSDQMHLHRRHHHEQRIVNQIRGFLTITYSRKIPLERFQCQIKISNTTCSLYNNRTFFLCLAAISSGCAYIQVNCEDENIDEHAEMK